MPLLPPSSRRHVTVPGELPTVCGPTSLADLPRDRSATITGFRVDADPAIARRLFDLGFVPGAEVELIRRAPLADPMVFAVAGYEIALRRALARLINVKVTP